MKKFSKITNQKVNEEPKSEVKLDESHHIKYKMIDLMDQLLSITTYGPIDRYQRAGLIKITGKEMLAEAIGDMLTDISVKDKTILLESLKTKIKDWEEIDSRIKSLQEETASINNKKKMYKLMEMYTDEETLLNVSESKSLKISNIKTLKDYIIIVNENKLLKEETKSKLVEIYINRIKEIES